MDHSISRRTGRPQLRATAKAGWTKAKQIAFLDHLAATCNISAAVKVVGLSIQSVYALRRRDPLFASRWMTAIEAGYELLETALLARAMGTDSETEGDLPLPDASRATVVGFDPELAMRMLGRHAPANRRAPGVRGGARTIYKQVTIEDVEASLMTKLDAIEKRLAGRRPKDAPSKDVGGSAPSSAILPRQGEVAPKVPEGEDTEQRSSFPPPPSGHACHLPLAGEESSDSTMVKGNMLVKPERGHGA